MKNKIALLTIALIGMSSNVSAFIDNGNGTVTLEYGESYGSIANDYNMNYMDLGQANGVNPHDVVVHPGDVINIGGATFEPSNENHMCDNIGTYTENQTYVENPSYTESQYYGQPAYNEYSEEYGYYDDCGNWTEGYNTLASDGNRVDYGTTYVEDTGYYSDVVYGSNGTSGSASIVAGYGGNAGQNVALACSLNNNIVIPAHGTYSASAYLGDGGYDMGFLDATCLNSDGTTYQAAGGGICPVTTTIHMAGKAAGLEVVQANPHNGGNGSTGVTYALPEDQAMFNAGTSDLVMVNPYDYPITLNCGYDGSVITASFNG